MRPKVKEWLTELDKVIKKLPQAPKGSDCQQIDKDQPVDKPAVAG